MLDEITSAPVPALLAADDESRPFFDGAADSKLMLKTCAACGTWHVPQALVCSNCLRGDLGWSVASGNGIVHSFSIVHRVQVPGFPAPYAIAIVELSEGPRLYAMLVDMLPETIAVGQRLTTTFRRLDNGTVMPFFTAA